MESCNKGAMNSPFSSHVSTTWPLRSFAPTNSVQVKTSDTDPGRALIAVKVKRYIDFPSNWTVSGVTENTGVISCSFSSIARFDFAFFASSSSLGFFARNFCSASSFSLLHTSRRALRPRFSTKMSLVWVCVAYTVPKSTFCRSSEEVIGVPVPLAFTATMMSLDSCTTRCSVSLTACFSSQTSVRCRYATSFGLRCSFFGFTLQSEFFDFRKQRTLASITELFVTFSVFVTGTRHFVLPQSSLFVSTSTRGPIGIAVSWKGYGTGCPRIFTYIGMDKGCPPAASFGIFFAINVMVITCELAGGTLPCIWSASNSAICLLCSSCGRIWNLAGSELVLCITRHWQKAYRMKISPKLIASYGSNTTVGTAHFAVMGTEPSSCPTPSRSTTSARS
mmetsp:Transcript_13284/g.32495  ORF Transcript_13284/g.32495 Transcript_13284/m.32495 type:complete len:392 (-) Transcript_13284:2180-3355(-)